MTVDRLVLDAHGVILNNPWQCILARLGEHTGQRSSVVRSRWFGQVRTPFWTGRIGPGEMWERLARGRPLPPGWMQVVEDHYEPGPAAQHLPRWAAAAPVWVLSNHHTPWLVDRLSRFGLADHIERIVVSDAVGAAKPDRRAFASVLEPTLDVCLVDDNPHNTVAATALGARTLLASGATGDWIAAVDELVGPRSIPARARAPRPLAHER